MKKSVLLIATILLFAITIYSDIYKELYIELVDLYLYLFIPALLPSVFLVLLIADTIEFKKIKSFNLALIAFYLLSIIGGTMTAIELARAATFSSDKDKMRYLALFSGGSVSFLLLAFANNSPLLLIALLSIVKITLASLTIKIDSFKESGANNYIFPNIQKTFLSLFNMLQVLTLTTLFFPLFTLVSNQVFANFLLGTFEFTRASLKLAQLETKYSLPLALFVIELNGLTSHLTIKKAHPEMSLSRFELWKVSYALLTLTIIWLSFF